MSVRGHLRGGKVGVMKKEAILYEKLDNKRVHCFLCAHQCKIAPSKFGICSVRQNIDGFFYTHVYEQAIANHIDPIEKKPLYHFFPGSSSYSIATIGCNFKCDFCQNWQISQSSKKDTSGKLGYNLGCSTIVKEAKSSNCKSISYTYTEPTIFFEYALDTAILAKNEGLYNNFVTNGYMTRQALEKIKPYLDASNVDLKSFREDFYKKFCGGRLQPVLDSIKIMKEMGIWVEITTLLIPDQNDSDDELRKIAEFIAGVGVEIPWHISRFHPDYNYLDSYPTPVETLKRAKKIGDEEGLRYIYMGNVLEGNNTYCYNCKELLIERSVFDINKLNIKDGKCPKCRIKLDGIF